MSNGGGGGARSIVGWGGAGWPNYGVSATGVHSLDARQRHIAGDPGCQDQRTLGINPVARGLEDLQRRIYLHGWRTRRVVNMPVFCTSQLRSHAPE